MKEIIRSIFIVLIALPSICFAEIIQANNSTIIEHTLQSSDTDTLVIFDVDDVLIAPKDQVLQAQNREYLEELNKKLEQSVGQENINIFYSIIFEHRKNAPVDARMKDIISVVQSKGIKVLALTNCFTGSFGNIKSMEEWRYQDLSKNGYRFDLSWPTLLSKTFTGLEKAGNGLSAQSKSMPVFMKGIVFTSAVSKGRALEAFLQYAGLTPKRIIFIDDKRKHLESVEEIASSHNIPFVGIEYTAVTNIHNEPVNQKRAELQYEILAKEKRWISDSEADELLTHSLH